MRVLHIDAGKLYGGVETLLVTLARYRHLCPETEPEFAVCFDGRLSEELAANGVPVHMLGEVRIRRPISMWRARQRLSKLLSERGFDAVVCHMAWPQAIFGPVARSAGVPEVFWMHDAARRHWLERWAGRVRPDLVICNSSFTASTLPNIYPGLPAKVIHCPVGAPDAGDVSGVRAEFDTSREAVVIIQTSRMEEWKGHTLHLKALANLRDIPNWVCWIVGGAQRPSEVRYLEKLKLMVAEAGIAERVRFIGQRSDVARLLAAADLFCQPNTGPEPFGIAFIEALYAGLPVVTSAIGGAREIVDDTCGMLVKEGDVAALSAALRNLMRDPDTRARLGAHGPARARALCDPAQQMQRLALTLSTVAHAGDEATATAGTGWRARSSH
jgi:glycosyltransferase involved in cell wall biosynthesis